MKCATSAAACVLTFSLAVLPVQADAQGRGNGQAKKSGMNTAPAGAKAKADTGKKPTVSKPSTAKAPKTEAHATKISNPKASNSKHARTTPSTTTTTTAVAPAVLTPTTPITQHVKNPKLEARLLTLLPPGATIADASQGFKNWGQFVAAVHVSNNLGIPFADLKARMTGLTPGAIPGTTVATTPMSLGQAIQSVRGTVPTTTPTTPTTPLSPSTIQTEVKKAEDAANTDLRRTRERS